MSRSDEPGRDPRLQAALRHAPDGEVAVPPLLRARIVAAGQRSADASRHRRPWWRRLDAGWNPWRMGGAGTAAAAVLAATVLWVGRDEQPTAPDPRPLPHSPATGQGGAGARAVQEQSRPIEPGTAESAAHGSAAATPAPPQATSPLAAERKVEAAGQTAAARRAAADEADAAAGTAAADRAAAQATDRRSAGALRQSASPQRDQPAVAAAAPAERPTPFADAAPPPAAQNATSPRPPPPAAGEAAAPARQEQRADNGAALRMRQGAAGSGAAAQAPAPAPAPSPAPASGPLPAPSPAPSPAPVPAPAAPAPVPAPAPAGTLASATPAEPSAAMPSVRPPATQREMAPANALRNAELGRGALLSATRRPLVEAWLAVPEATAWRRRAPAGEEAPLAVGWLAELAAATRGRWTIAPSGNAGSPDAAAATEAWTLVHPGGKTGRLTWVTGGVLVCDLQAALCEQARLEQNALEALRLGLRR